MPDPDHRTQTTDHTARLITGVCIERPSAVSLSGSSLQLESQNIAGAPSSALQIPPTDLDFFFVVPSGIMVSTFRNHSLQGSTICGH